MRRLACAMIAATAPLLAAPPAVAGEHCRIGPAKVVAAGRDLALSVPIACADRPGAETVKYPGGPLYVGATLLKQPGLVVGRISRLEPKADRVDATDLPAIALNDRPVSSELRFPLTRPLTATHALVAVWDARLTCPVESPQENHCAEGVAAVYGKFDGFEMPIPVDAWPRPVCNKAALKASGFFAWVSESGDPAGHAIPSKLERDFALNDCFTEVPGDGLGFSVRRWRMGPVASP